MSDQDTNGRKGFSGFSLVLWFAGGALAGAAGAYLMQAQNRARVRDLAERTRDKAGRIPKALHDASSAAQDAFAASYGANGDAAKLTEPKR
ncbi:MAG TPA: hypothetical protein VGQ83_05885 [Polyangia bacterium]|jgi:hypothetical protein